MKKCEKCKKNEAKITMRIVVNGDLNVKELCEECHEIAHSELSPDGILAMAMGGMGKDVIDMIRASLGRGIDEPEQVVHNGTSEQKKAARRPGLLDKLAKNLNDLAMDGKIDPVIGREQEIDQVIEVLLRRGKNNPVLIGEGGVGKTAIAEGLALRLIQDDVPEQLRGREIYSLDVSRITEGTGIHGSLEAKLHAIIEEAQERKVILFMDEIHQIVGTGAHGGAMDIANMFKPALARGELQVFGATTLKEYRIIERDPALERRFQPIQVAEPSVEDTVLILEGLQSRYEDFHRVTYTREALEAAAKLSARYIADRQLPDKAIDLINAAGARVNLYDYTKSGAREKVLIEKEKEQAVHMQDFERAAELRKQENELSEKIIKSDRLVTVELIESILEEMTHIPVSKLQAGEQEKIKNLQEHLSGKVIGQSQAVEKVAKAIRRARVGLKNKNKPVASFLFYGPTGVGKTELARSLAETLFGDKEALIRIDMSEYSEKHTVSKMIGSPPGYVGHEEAGQLTEKVRRKPYSVILADEIDKAHPEVLNTFLQALEDGRMTDSKGRVVSFKDTIVIMTTNAGSATEVKRTVGFTKDDAAQVVAQGKAALKGFFKPEFLNRFDAVIPFAPLLLEDMLAILELMLKEVEAMLSEQGKSMLVSDEAKKHLATLGYDPAFGARPLRLVIQEKVIDAIADVLIEKENVSQFSIELSDNQEIVIR